MSRKIEIQIPKFHSSNTNTDTTIFFHSNANAITANEIEVLRKEIRMRRINFSQNENTKIKVSIFC